MKAKISFAVRPSTAPGESAETLVPVIVDRKPPVSLTKVVENAIDRGLIVGPKTSAAEEIARGIADQIYKEFCEGRGVKFGEYFYGRPYLDGICGPNGNLTKANNRVNARLYKGADFNLSLSDFSFEFEGADDQPKIEWLLPTGSSGAPTRNVLEEGKPVSVLGKFLKLDGDTARVEFKEVGGEATVDVTTFTAAGPDVLTFPWPATLDASKSYAVTVYRTQEDGTVRSSNSKRVTVKAGEPVPPGLTLTGVRSPGGGELTIRIDSGIWFEGTGLDAWNAETDRIDAKNDSLEESEYRELTESGGGEAVFADGLLKLDEGAWEIIGPDLEVTEGSQVHFRVTIGGLSAEIVATVSVS